LAKKYRNATREDPRDKPLGFEPLATHAPIEHQGQHLARLSGLRFAAGWLIAGLLNPSQAVEIPK
jgi:hypothetical protein